jgi:phage terminase Nu1 subunit (DNA packaging protein)
VSETSGQHRRRGRVEAALEKELIDRHDVGPAERAALRAQAFAVDLAEAAFDAELISTASRAYLELRQAAGIVAGIAKAPDTLEQLFAELGRAGAGASDTADT